MLESKDPIERELLSFTADVRRIYALVLQTSLGSSDTAGSCLYAAILLMSTINRFSQLQARVRGGGPGDGGFLDAKGVSHGHYWVEATHPATGRGWVADVTADQFGLPPVVVLDLPASLRHYHPGTQDVVDAHVRNTGLPVLAPVEPPGLAHEKPPGMPGG